MHITKAIKFGLFILILGGPLIYFSYNNRDQNQLVVNVNSSLSIDKIRIELGFYSINEFSDENLIKNGLDNVVFSDSKAKIFETKCGENDFLVVYDDAFYAIVRHFIPNDFNDGIPEPHTYNFDFKRKGDKIYLTLNIEGKNGVEIKKVMANLQTLTKK